MSWEGHKASPGSIGDEMAEEDVLDAIADVADKVNDCLDKLNDLKDQIENLEMVSYNLCTMCQGSGQIVPSYSGDTPPSPITCPACAGAGKVALGSAKEKD